MLWDGSELHALHICMHVQVGMLIAKINGDDISNAAFEVVMKTIKAPCMHAPCQWRKCTTQKWHPTVCSSGRGTHDLAM